MAADRAMRRTRRRSFLGGAAALSLAPGVLTRPSRAAAQAPSQPPSYPPSQLSAPLEPEVLLEVDLPQLEYPGDWNPRPGAMRELALEARMRTRLEPLREPSTVTATSAALFGTPFLYIAGEGGLPNLGEIAEARLARFLGLGGMLVFDAADGGTDRGFERDARALLGRIAPGSLIAPVSPEHVLYRSFYLVDAPLGRTAASDTALGIEDEGRLKVLLLRNDLGGALARGENLLPTYPCVPGGPKQREEATRFAVNILLYATCTDYKSDRAHVETLLMSKRRR